MFNNSFQNQIHGFEITLAYFGNILQAKWNDGYELLEGLRTCNIHPVEHENQTFYFLLKSSFTYYKRSTLGKKLRIHTVQTGILFLEQKAEFQRAGSNANVRIR